MAVYTPFQLANAPGNPYAANPSAGGVYQSIAAQLTPSSAFVTPNQRENQRQRSELTPIPEANPIQLALAKQMMATGSSTAPVRSPLEGLARTLTGVAGGYFAGEAGRAQQARQDALGGRIGQLTGLTEEEAQGLSPEQALSIATVKAKAIKAPKETWRTATSMEISDAGLPLEKAWRISSRGNMKDPEKAGQTITIKQIDQKGRVKLAEKLAEVDATRIEGAYGAVDTLRNLNTELQTVTKALEKFPTGGLADAKITLGPMAKVLGIEVEGLAEGELIQSLMARLVPAMRVTGSGTTSDFDAGQFVKSLPSLSKTVEGNKLIIKNFGKILKRKAAEAEFMRGYAEEHGSLYGSTPEMVDAALAPAFTEEERAAMVAAGGTPDERADVSTLTLEQLLALDPDNLTPEQDKAVGKRLDELTPRT